MRQIETVKKNLFFIVNVLKPTMQYFSSQIKIKYSMSFDADALN